jgi:hypothetical protein
MGLEDEVTQLFKSTMLSDVLTDETLQENPSVASPATLASLNDRVENLLIETAALSASLGALREATGAALRRLASEIEKAK